MRALDLTPLLRIPAFPGAKFRDFAVVERSTAPGDHDIGALLRRMAELRVGGSYWATQPELPQSPYTVVKVRDRAARQQAVATLPEQARYFIPESDCDPWHILSGASELQVDTADELALVALAAGVPVRWIGDEAGLTSSADCRLRAAFEASVVAVDYADPFTGAAISVEQALELCGFYRRLVDANRQIEAALGFALWKRPTVEPLLWGGSDVKFVSSPPRQGTIAVWKSRISSQALATIESSEAKLLEVEDGFIRSAGLGADCVPPLSIVVDSVGIYFDPRKPSQLEQLLQSHVFDEELLERARSLRALIVRSGISKYSAGAATGAAVPTGRRRILVPGQVEDDRSVLTGGGRVRTNLDLLKRVRERAPDADILYKPHPDVEAGHRIGSIADNVALEFADEIVRGQPITALIDSVDEVHVITSLAGFEALLRGKPVTTYGVPFYAGWGLTDDLGDVPARRTARRSLDELVAAALLLYPRYLDPKTGLPCPPEVLILRLSDGLGAARKGVLITLRRLQGRLRRVWSRL